MAEIMHKPSMVDTVVTPRPAWFTSLQVTLGAGAVTDDATELAFFAQDVFSTGAPLSAVITPASVDELRKAVKILAAADVAIVPRGGGLSYTDGFLATKPHSALIDMSRVNRLVELNVGDRYVTVETGMCWGTLNELLEPHGLRTPYWGPLSGLRSTVGGALSQGSVFLGSGEHGSVGDTVLSIEVVLADGSILTTGSAAAAGIKPFLRYFGPDMTGLFIGDAGALGIKARATLKLLPRQTAIDFVSAEFGNPLDMIEAMSEISRHNVASECFSFDPVLLEQRKKRMSLLADAKTLMQVVKQSGLKAGLGLVKSGRDFVGEDKYSAHVAVEGRTAGEVAAKVDIAKRIFGRNGVATENSFPKALRAMPFAAPNSMLGPAGERWVPVHAIFPHSAAQHAFAEIQSFFAGKQALLDAHQIRIGYLCTTVAQQGYLIEPVFYWNDGHTAYHKRVVEADYLKKCGEPAANPSATAAVGALKAETAQLLRSLGGTHFQIGKFYTYREGRNPAALALFDAIKKHLDPNSIMNPGVLK
ncbi:MAG: FAD-binding oxidoreductase [Aeromicrobium sp.]|nr:FAD-binding oxidoreductase [Burkholderiales bacterium]